MLESMWVTGKRTSIFVLCTFLLSLQFITTSFAQGNRPETAAWGTRGQTAINKLGTRLPAVAARYNMTPDQLAKTFRSDFNLWVDKFDNLVYLDEFVPQNTATIDGGGTTAAGPLPYSQTFLLHSLPGATKVIYLDFDGHTTSGTFWNSNFNAGADIVSTPFDMDSPANPAFSNAELDRIQYIWQRVAEEYAPFGVDVTTQDPGIEGLRNTGSGDTAWGMRVVISPTNSFYPNAGGVAWIGSFNWDSASYHPTSHTPCFVFSSMLGPNSEKFVADAIAHEVGHTLGLNHDGKTDGTSYYSGNYNTTNTSLPQWAPIMGVGYYQSLVQWSKGEYSLANNLQDDLAVMTSSYGITYRTDDHSNAITGATPLTVNGTAVSGKGIIEQRTDVDYLSFQTGAGNVSFTLSGNPRDSNLDIQVKLFDANGVQILINNPTGLASSFSTTLTAGTYYLAIDGVGTGDPLAGYYSDYGSIGEFNISGTVVSTAATIPTAPTSLVATAASASQINLTWADASSNETGFKVESSLNNSTWTLVTTVGSNVTSYSNTGLTAGTLYYFRVCATNTAGDSATTNVAQATTQATAPAAPTTLTASAASATQINLTWVDASSNENGFKVERSLNNSTWTLVANPSANITSYSDINLTAGTLYYYRVRANNNAGDSANSNVAQATTLTTAPTAPTSLAATATSASQINLTWADASSNETGFKVERSLNNLTWTLVTTVGSNVTSYSNTGLTASTLYYYRVRATNAAGDSANSNLAQATTQATASATKAMHVGDIDHTKTTSKTGWSTTATITIHNASDAILSSATVTGTWSNGATGTATCKTSTKGVCSISKTGIAGGTTAVTFTVTGVTLSGYTYAATSNHDPDGSSNGTTVTIAKP